MTTISGGKLSTTVQCRCTCIQSNALKPFGYKKTIITQICLKLRSLHVFFFPPHSNSLLSSRAGVGDTQASLEWKCKHLV